LGGDDPEAQGEGEKKGKASQKGVGKRQTEGKILKEQPPTAPRWVR